MEFVRVLIALAFVLAAAFLWHHLMEWGFLIYPFLAIAAAIGAYMA